MRKPLDECSREELVEIIKSQKETISRTKKFGLVWEDKPEKVATDCAKKLPVIKEVADRAINKAGDSEPTNIIIEGDNYHALSVLNYTHAGKIDVIYIDPPYNTGATDWRYNNNYVDSNDAYRHSKWISMMEKRLKLAKNLLSPKGFLICAIDENEIHNIRYLLDSIFGEANKVGMVTVLHNPKGRNLSKFFSENSEFMLVYAIDAKNSDFNKVAIDDEIKASFDKQDEIGKYRLQPYMRCRTVWSRANKPKNYYPIYVSPDLQEITLECKEGYHELWPKTKDGREWAWKNIPSSFKELNHDGYFVAEKEGEDIVLFHKYYEQQVLKNVWTDKKYQSEFNGTNLLKALIGQNQFDFPKSIYLVEDIIKLTAPKDGTILDYFAGSGTTGHAVMELNDDDGGHRQFILCTNNENKIAEEVTYPRIVAAMKEYVFNGKKQHGIPTNLRYFKTTFIDRNDTLDKLRRELSPACEDMIRVREGAYEKIIDDDMLKVFKNSRGLTAIIYDRFELAEHIKRIETLETDAPVHLYVFSYSKSDRKDEMPENLKHKYEAQPIPEGVLEIYKKIFANIKGGKNA